MAAAALTYLFGLRTDQVQYAAEIALEHHLGLTCDPICGLVQVPCIERNAVAAMRAMNSCNLAYFLADTQRISFDIVVRTMYETGISMNQRFRGADRIFKLGGAQAVAALAYGTESVPRVDKIVGPGGIYVATAKRKVFGRVAIDMVAGPSEILVLADGGCRPRIFGSADVRNS